MRNPYKLTFKQLMLSNVYLGSRKESFNLMIKSFVLGYRGNFLILNLSYTYLQFRLLTYLIINFVLVHKKLLIVKELDPFNLKISLKSKNIFFYDKK